MKTLVKVKEGSPIPHNGKFVTTTQEKELVGETYSWEPSPGIMGLLPLFRMETQYRTRHYKTVTYFHYEVETGN